MTTQTTSKPKALFVLSSATELPLAEPVGHAPNSTGFFLVEMAQVLKEFEHDYEFVFATPEIVAHVVFPARRDKIGSLRPLD